VINTSGSLIGAGSSNFLTSSIEFDLLTSGAIPAVGKTRIGVLGSGSSTSTSASASSFSSSAGGWTNFLKQISPGRFELSGIERPTHVIGGIANRYHYKHLGFYSHQSIHVILRQKLPGNQ
jgi:hypothetical protein